MPDEQDILANAVPWEFTFQGHATRPLVCGDLVVFENYLRGKATSFATVMASVESVFVKEKPDTAKWDLEELANFILAVQDHFAGYVKKKLAAKTTAKNP